MSTLSPAAVADEPPSAIQPGPWELVKVKDGITVRRRKIPGMTLQEFQGRAIVEAPISRVMAVMDDEVHRTEWSDRCKEARVIAELGERVELLYDRTAAPWPVADRDAVARAETTVDVADRSIRIEFETVVDPRVPPVQGVVRMPFLKGHWLFRPTHEGEWTELEYQVVANPGGSLPDWVSNLASKSIPMLTIEGLRKQVKKDRYADWAQRMEARAGFKSILAPSPAATRQP